MDEFFEIIAGFKKVNRSTAGWKKTEPDACILKKVLGLISEHAHKVSYAVPISYSNDIILPKLQKKTLSLSAVLCGMKSKFKLVKTYSENNVLPIISPIDSIPHPPVPKASKQKTFNFRRLN